MYVDIYECVIDENFFFVSLDVESFVFDALRSSLPRDDNYLHTYHPVPGSAIALIPGPFLRVRRSHFFWRAFDKVWHGGSWLAINNGGLVYSEHPAYIIFKGRG